MNQILVAIDFSAVTETVVDTAAHMAGAFGGEVTLLNVAPREPDVLGVQLTRKIIAEPVPEDVRDRYDKLADWAAVLRQRGITAHTRLIRGDRVRTILAEAERLNALVIIMGSHGQSGLLRRLVGSVSEGVLREGRFPLLVIPLRMIESEQPELESAAGDSR